MASIEELENSVMEQARQKGKLKLLEEQEQIKSDFDKQKAHFLGIKESDFQQKIKELKQAYQVECQQIKNKERQSTLVSKQAILGELFQAAYHSMVNWSKEQEINFVRQILSKYLNESAVISFGQETAQKLGSEEIDKLKLEYPKMIFSNDFLAQELGLVISIGKVDDNYLYRHLVDSVYKEESPQIANEIFMN